VDHHNRYFEIVHTARKGEGRSVCTQDK
jgi:hypothetical protein